MIPRTLFHTGDIGDIIAALPTIRAMGGGELVIGERHGGQRESLRGARFEALAPLLLAQPYVQGVRWGGVRIGMLDFSGFRTVQDHGTNLAYWQAQWMNTQIDLEPWLVAQGSGHGRPVLARSLRYHNPDFPWREVLERVGREALFVGLPSEYEAFCKEFGCSVKFVPTPTLLDTARVIAGARVFVGNQSSPWWMAAGLGVPCWQETFPEIRNSIIHRAGMYYPHFNGNSLDGLR